MLMVLSYRDDPMVTIEMGLVSFIVVNTDDGDMDGTRNQNSMDISLWGSSSV